MTNEERAAEAVRVFLTKTRNGVDMEHAMQAALEAAGLNELVAMLEERRERFDEYAIGHASKGTEDGNQKAIRNAVMRDKIAALTGDTKK